MTCSHKNASSSIVCPAAGTLDGRNMMPMDLAEGSSSSSDGASSLSGDRVGSSIPRVVDDAADGDATAAAPAAASTTWMYPSPQMFYNALDRKGHQPRPEDMGVIVTIHNMVNEQTWQQVLKWEDYYHPGAAPKLLRFLGRPDSLSPRAFMRTYLFGYSQPFDRHDWYIRRADGSEARYVIDFYSGPRGPSPSFHIDARPALDSWSSFYERVHCASNKLVSKISSLFSSLKSS